MRFRVLGRVVAYNQRGHVPLGSARQRAVLAALLVEPGTSVAIDQLVDRVWGAAAPQRARQTLHTYLSRLRSLFGDAGGPVLARRSGSYALEVDESAVDLHQFRALVVQARRAADDDRAAILWQEAMALWQGEPFAELDSDWLRAVAVGLEAERAAAVLDRTDVLLRRGEHARLLPELATAVSAHPLDERVAGQLMVALYRCGRQADALAHFRRLHDRLVDELGSDPGPELRELHQRILRHDPELNASAASQAPEPPDPAIADPPPGGTADLPPRPAQLPADVAGFTGRTTDLQRLDQLLADQSNQAVVITAIGGTAGVGKTALAVHWTHRVAERFPDGQLYVNLRGYDPDQPMSPADALARFLTALGVTGQSIPIDLDERAARYRSELAGRRMLIVLDNAASVAQVRPLLPGTGSCLVVVTSRDSLAGLVAVHGAHRLDLDLLSGTDAVNLLRQLIGSRVEAEPDAAAALAEQCVRLPLALRVAAELAVSRPENSLADLTAELADRQARLELLDTGGDPYAAVREVFSWSIQHLPGEAARTFRLLGLHPGPDLDPYAAAALTDTGPDEARRELELLARAHLVHRTARGRYGMHDLLRAYATHLAATEETDQQRQAAEGRLHDYYQAAAGSAMDALHPAQSHYRPASPGSATATPDLTEPGAAHAWLDAERSCLVAAAAHAAAHGHARYAVDLARTICDYLMEHPTDLLTVGTHALRAVEQAGDIGGAASALRLLGGAYNLLGRHELAVEHGQQALTWCLQAHDLVGQGLALTVLSNARYLLGDYKQSIDDDHQAIAVFRKAGDPLGEAGGLLNLATTEDRLGRYGEAADHFQQALAVFRRLGSQSYEAATLNNLANLELRQGDYQTAGEHLRQSLSVLRRLGNPIMEAHALDTLGILQLRLGEAGSATEYFQEALDRYRATGERNGQAWSINGLGEAAQLADHPTDALAHHIEALGIATETGSRHQQARAHAGLGHAYRDLGELDQARSHYDQAHALYTELDMPDAENVRAHLTALTATEA